MERTIDTAVEVDLGYATVKLLFDMDAMISLEEIGLPATNLEPAMSAAPFGTLRKLIWAGAKATQTGLKIEDVGPMLDLRKMDTVASAVTAALNSQLPEPAKTENPQAPPAIQ